MIGHTATGSLAVNLENLSPVEIDTIYVERLRRLCDAEATAANAANRVVRTSGKYVGVYEHGDGCYVRKETAFVAYRQYRLAEVQPYVLDVQTCIAEGLAPADAVDAYCAATEALSEARVEVAEIDAIYAANPWSRYWLVTSSDGHIHRSCHCHTCNKGLRRTGFALVPSLSGQTADEAVRALGPALCTACFPEAPVEDREQVTIPARIALTLWEKGFEAFQQARQKAAEDSQKRAEERCPGSGQQGIGEGNYSHRCPCCGDLSRRTSTGKVRPHKAPKYIVRQAWGSKCWTGSGWGTSAKAAVYTSREEANAVAAQVSTPEQKAESCRK
jgi:hypothetical protein